MLCGCECLDKPLNELLRENVAEQDESIFSLDTSNIHENLGVQTKILNIVLKDFCAHQGHLSPLSQHGVSLLRPVDLSECVLRLCLAVLNGYHMAEEDWIKADFQNLRGSLVVDELLKEKRKKFSVIIACLSSANLFYDLPLSLRFQISGFAEELVASLRMNEFYCDQECIFVTKSIFHKAMEAILQRNNIERNNKSVATAFFSQVTQVFAFMQEFFDQYAQEIRWSTVNRNLQTLTSLGQMAVEYNAPSHATRSSTEVSRPLLAYAVNELYVRLAFSIFDHREKNRSVYFKSPQEERDATVTSHFPELVGILQELCAITWTYLGNNASTPGGSNDERIQAEEMEVVGDTSSLPLREKLFLQLYRLYYISFYQIRIQVNAASPGNNSNDQANQSTSTNNNNNNSLFSRPIDSSIDSALARDQFLEYKRQSISLLLEARQIGYALDLAETFEDYEALIYICEETDFFHDNAEDQLMKYAKNYISNGFPSVLFNWFLKKGKIQKLIDLFPFLDTQREMFLLNYPKLLWLYYARKEKYNDSSIELTKLAFDTNNFVEKKCFLALDVICNELNETKATLEAMNKNYRHRELSQYQDRLYAISKRDEFRTRVLSPIELIEATWTIAHQPSVLDIASAFQIYTLTVKDRDYDSNARLLVDIISKTLLLDNWENISRFSNSDDDLIENIKSTYLVQVCIFSAEVRLLITPRIISKLIYDLHLSSGAREIVQSAYAMVYQQTEKGRFTS